MYNYLTGKVNEFVLKGNEIKSSIKKYIKFTQKEGKSPKNCIKSDNCFLSFLSQWWQEQKT